MKILDKLIEERGFQKGEVVKLGYNDIVNFTNQRVIEELEGILNKVELDSNPYIIKGDILNRIKELKQGKDD